MNLAGVRKVVGIIALLLAFSSSALADRKEAIAELKQLGRPITSEGFKYTCKAFDVGFHINTNSDESRLPGEKRLINLMSLYLTVGEKGWTPSECLAWFIDNEGSLSDANVVDFLLKSGASANYKRPNVPKPLTITPVLFTAASTRFFTQRTDLDHAIRSMKLMLDAGGDINEPDNNYSLGKRYPINKIVEATVFHKKQNNKKEYALMTDFIVYLIKHGANVNAGIDSTNTPLASVLTSESFSPERTDVELIKLLIANGANVNAHVWYGNGATTSRGGTLLAYAKEKGMAEIVDILTEHGAKETVPAKETPKKRK